MRNEPTIVFFRCVPNPLNKINVEKVFGGRGYTNRSVDPIRYAHFISLPRGRSRGRSRGRRLVTRSIVTFLWPSHGREYPGVKACLAILMPCQHIPSIKTQHVSSLLDIPGERGIFMTYYPPHIAKTVVFFLHLISLC